MDKQIIANDIQDFLDSDGAVGLLLMIDKDDGTITTDLENKIDVTPPTANKRIGEARELDLVELTYDPDDHGGSKRHVLTKMGRVLRVALESIIAAERYEKYVQLDDEVDQAENEIIDWIDDHKGTWNQRFSQPEFEITDKLMDEESYPGEDVPEDFQRYLEGETPLIEDVRRSIQENTSGSDGTTTGDSVEDDSEE